MLYAFTYVMFQEVCLQSAILKYVCDHGVSSGEDCSEADPLFEAMNQCFKKDEIDWENAVSIGLDNTNTNVGSDNLIKTRIHEENKKYFIAGCNCHPCHLAVETGVKRLPKNLVLKLLNIK